MKLIHCADLHLDSKMTTNLSAEQAKERRAEILRTFVHMVEYADAQQVDAVLIAGDLFDTRNVSATARNVVRAAIVDHPNIQFYYLKGNHDNDNFLSKLDEIPSNLNLFGEGWTTYQCGNVTITGVEITEENKSTIAHSLVLPHDGYHIVTLHGQLEEIGLERLANKNIDYLALGHVHQMQVGRVDTRGMYAYSGCLEGRGFDECGQKGFILLDINEEEQTATYKFVPLASRTLYELPVDVTGIMNTNEVAQRIERAVNEVQISAKSLVKIRLQGEVDVESEIGLEYLHELFEEYYYCLKIVDETKLLIRFSDYEKDESLKGEFVRMVMQSDLSEAEQAEIIRTGILALSGEEI